MAGSPETISSGCHWTPTSYIRRSATPSWAGVMRIGTPPAKLTARM